MKLNTTFLDELITNCPEILPNFKFYIPKKYIDYPKQYRGFEVTQHTVNSDNIYFGKL